MTRADTIVLLFALVIVVMGVTRRVPVTVSERVTGPTGTGAIGPVEASTSRGAA